MDSGTHFGEGDGHGGLEQLSASIMQLVPGGQRRVSQSGGGIVVVSKY